MKEQRQRVIFLTASLSANVYMSYISYVRGGSNTHVKQVSWQPTIFSLTSAL